MSWASRGAVESRPSGWGGLQTGDISSTLILNHSGLNDALTEALNEKMLLQTQK